MYASKTVGMKGRQEKINKMHKNVTSLALCEVAICQTFFSPATSNHL